MKHEVTSYHTKRAIADALKTVMRQKPFSKITVTEIIQICGINRKTFYYHFEDIFALLRWTFDEEAIEVVKHFDLLTHYEDAIRFVMNYVSENDYLISCARDSIGRSEMMRFFYADFLGVVTSVVSAAEQKLNTHFDPEFRNLAAQFYTEALAGMLLRSVTQNNRRKTEQDIKNLTTIIDLALQSMELYALKRQ